MNSKSISQPHTPPIEIAQSLIQGRKEGRGCVVCSALGMWVKGEDEGGHLGSGGGGKLPLSLINGSGGREESLEGLIHGLVSLQSISQSIFSALGDRIQGLRSSIQHLNNRTHSAQLKLNQVKGSGKGLRIVSSAKYPQEGEGEGTGGGPTSLKPLLIRHPTTSNGTPPHPPPSGGGGGGDRGGDRLELIPSRETLPTRFEPPIIHPDDLLTCFHVREPCLPSLNSALSSPGLGKAGPPPSLANVDSFLIFNTLENPYQHYRLPGKGASGGSGGSQGRGARLPETHPILQPSEPNLSTTTPKGGVTSVGGGGGGLDDFYYSPSTHTTIPDIDVPDTLPNLTGIVEDLLDFCPPSELSFQGFWPSPPPDRPPPSAAASTGLVPTPSAAAPSSTLAPRVPATASSTPSSSRAPLDPPPPPGGGAAPPPPPPPPPAPSSAIPIPQHISHPPSKQGGGGGEEGRNNLMEAIRAAGGAGKASLRSAQERKYEVKKRRKEEMMEVKNAAATGGGGGGGEGDGSGALTSSSNIPVKPDLMADLKNSLAMRRKGISGIRVNPRGGGGGGGGGGSVQIPRGGVGGIMEKLATTIPMDKSTEEDEEELGEESEEEENDDWD